MTAEADPALFRARFDISSLSRVRRAAAARLHMTGLLRHQAQDLTLALGEILNNAVQHGGGHGEITMTDIDGRLQCRVSDEGTGLAGDPYRYGVRCPEVTARRGRGLWTVFSLYPATTVTSSRSGTHVALTVESARRRPA